MNTHPMTDRAIEEAVSADHARRIPWLRVTRAETAVDALHVPELPAACEPFELWPAVAA